MVFKELLMNEENIKSYVLRGSEREFVTRRKWRKIAIAIVILSACFCTTCFFFDSYIAAVGQSVLTVAAVIWIFTLTGKRYKDTYPEKILAQGSYVCYWAVSCVFFTFFWLDISAKSNAMYKLLIVLGEILFLAIFYSAIFALIKNGKIKKENKNGWKSNGKYTTVIVVIAYGWARVFLNNVPENKIYEIMIALSVFLSLLFLTQTQDLLKYYFIKKYLPSKWADLDL